MLTVTYDDKQWQLVPKEPTSGMMTAGMVAISEAPDLGGIVSPNTAESYDCYRTMLAAAPPPPAASAEPVAWKPLTDAQWMNIVNHDHSWSTWDKEDAVHAAVRMVEVRLRANNAGKQQC